MPRLPLKLRLAALFVLLPWTLTCNNYDLLKQLENPGSGSGASGCTNCRIFVTAVQFNGNLGGFTGADMLCRTDPANPAGPGNGNWKAMVVGNGRHACVNPSCSVSGASEGRDWVLKPNTTYVRPDGATIATTNASAIFDFPMPGVILTAPSLKAWTGLSTGWTVSGGDQCAIIDCPCQNWIDGSTGASTTHGIPDSDNNQAITGGVAACNATGQRLYCVEQ